ncbi:MAG: hypothetical protein U0528_06350 [Anaerolineae bacterium]
MSMLTNALVAVLFYSLVIWQIVYALHFWFRLRFWGITTTGVVLEKLEGRSGKRFIEYQFEVTRRDTKAQTYRRKTQVFGATYDALTEQSNISIHYMPYNPAISKIIDDNYNTYTFIILGIFYFLILTLWFGNALT